jgi:hypothetical protein
MTLLLRSDLLQLDNDSPIPRLGVRHLVALGAATRDDVGITLIYGPVRGDIVALAGVLVR